jgi:5,10-methylenetetrahydromethanopterin reductase
LTNAWRSDISSYRYDPVSPSAQTPLMPIGLALDGMIPIGEMVDLARRADADGLASLWMAEHMGYRDGVGSAMAFLGATTRLTVVPTAISVYSRHPMIAAMAAATLEELAPGRTLVSVASGNPRALGEMGLAVREPVGVTREFVEVVRALLTGEPVAYTGKHYRLDGARLHVVPRRPIPLFMAVMGPRMLELAGEIADGVVLSAGLSPVYIRTSLERVRAGAVRAGRPDARVTAAGFVLAAAADDRDVARFEAKRMLAYLSRNTFIAENLDVTGTRFDRAAVADAAVRGDWKTAARLIPDEAVSTYGVAGTPEDCRRQLEPFLAAGLDLPILLPVGDARARWLAIEAAKGAH